MTSAVFAPKNSCTALLPTAWESGVDNASPPRRATTDLDNLKEWTKFAIGQTGQLQKSNERYVAAVGIVQRCEDRDKAAIEKSKPKFLGIF